jgi:hypothetical protein
MAIISTGASTHFFANRSSSLINSNSSESVCAVILEMVKHVVANQGVKIHFFLERLINRFDCRYSLGAVLGGAVIKPAGFGEEAEKLPCFHEAQIGLRLVIKIPLSIGEELFDSTVVHFGLEPTYSIGKPPQLRQTPKLLKPSTIVPHGSRNYPIVTINGYLFGIHPQKFCLGNHWDTIC